MSKSIPIERLIWSLFCPFPKIRASAEFTFAEKRSQNNDRNLKIRSFEYTSRRYDKPIDVLSLMINTDDNIAFKHVNAIQDSNTTDNGRVLLSYRHLKRFKDAINEIIRISTESCFEEIGDTGKFRLTPFGNSEDAVVVVEDLVFGSKIGFAPCIVEKYNPDVEGEDNSTPLQEEGEPGITFLLGSWEMSSSIPLDSFISFADFYLNFDLFATSRSAVQLFVMQSGGIPGVHMEKSIITAPERRQVETSSVPRNQSTGLSAKRVILKR